jgi:nitrite reductase (NADH) small subunit
MTATEVEVTLGPLSLIPPGEGRNFEVAGERIAVFHTRAGQVFATQAACPHKNGPLADGLVGADVVICPLHAWKFDLNTGEPLLGTCKLKTYPVRTNDQGLVLLTFRLPETQLVAM